MSDQAFKAVAKGVYGVRDADGRFRYIGMSYCDIWERKAAHLAGSKRPKTPFHAWLADNRDAEFVLLEMANDNYLYYREALWIWRLREEGHHLFNVMPKIMEPSIRRDMDKLSDALDAVERERA